MLLIGSVGTTKEANAEALKWNCLIQEWRLARPIEKKLDAPSESLDTPLIEEAAFTPEGDWERLVEKWEARILPVVEFGHTLTSAHVGYAVAVIECEEAGEGILAVGGDDGFRAYWNGAEVLASNSVKCVFLDDHVAPVKLRKGRNVLLMKLENWAGPAGFCARLIPHQDSSRRLAVATADDVIPIAEAVQVPDLVFELLDAAGGMVASFPCSGNRYRWAAWQPVSQRVGWLLYLPEAAPTFARVQLKLAGKEARVVAELPGMAFDQPVVMLKKEDWVQDPVRKVDLKLQLPNATPISGAVFFSAMSGERLPTEEVEPGSYRLPDPPLFRSDYAFTAPGRTNGEVWLWPDRDVRVISRGYAAEVVLLAQVVDSGEQPLAGALGRVLVGDKEHAVAISDDQGRLPFRLTAAEVTLLAKEEEEVVSIEVSAQGYAPIRLDPKAFQPTEQELAAGLEKPDGGGLTLPTAQLKATLQVGSSLEVAFVNAATGTPIRWEDAWVISQAEGAPSVTQHRDDTGIARLTEGHGPGSRLMLLAEGFIPQAIETDAALWEQGQYQALMQPAEPLHGIVLDADNRPLRGVAAWFAEFQGEEMPGGWVRTGMDGRFTIRTHTGSPVDIAIYGRGGPTFYVRMEKTSEERPMEIRLK
jgi:hypothetical protein